MRYSPIDPQLFVENRRRFLEYLPPRSLALFTANDILPTNADGTLPFTQNRDLFYLTGVDQEESLLILFPDAFQAQHRAILFLQETNDEIARWEGEKLSKARAREVSGIETVFWLSEFEKVLADLMSQAELVYLNKNEHLRAKVSIKTKEDRLIEWCKEHYPLHTYRRAAPILHRLRAVKTKWEVELMRHASRLNTQAFARVLRFLKPGLKEYELEAEFLHEYVRNGSPGFSYTPIIASGKNACVLHYIENKDTVEDGDLVLFDCGNWYANYASDVTRCFPANGKFSPRQRALYEAVLRVQEEALKLLRPGNQLHEYHRQVGELMTRELLDLKLLSSKEVKEEDPQWPAYKKYFMHGTSHYIGLDVHDVGLWTEKMEVGNAFTCEPGLYLPEEGIGIRIEDDIVIGETGNENLTAGIPKSVEAIEEEMNG